MLSACVALTICATYACNFKEPHNYGNKIDTAGARAINDAYAQAGLSKTCTVKGRISEVCQEEGCWLNAEGNNGTKTMLWFDHKFKVPKDIAGKTVVAQGRFYNDTSDVESLKELAKDRGLAQSAIDTIKTPKVEVQFLPAGVVIY